MAYYIIYLTNVSLIILASTYTSHNNFTCFSFIINTAIDFF